MASLHPVITWVNHASFVTEYAGIRLISDPWIEGTAFKDGWQLLSPSRFTYEDFGDITHIWVSHQHPDHFAPTNLRKIPREIRSRLTVLYQHTDDKLVVSWFKSAGFGRVIELSFNRWIELAPDFSVMCNTLGDDSWLAMRTGDRTLLNANDCVLKVPHIIQPIVEAVGPVDTLFTQFAYAQWVGNPPEADRRHAAALEKYDRIQLLNRMLAPKTIVPFASFIYFSHEENFYLNDQMTDVGDVASFLEHVLEKQAVVLYPGDTWNLGEVHDWQPAAQRYAADRRERMAAGPTHKKRSLTLADIQPHIEGFIQRLVKKNRFAQPLILDRTTVFFTDFREAYELSIKGMHRSHVSERQADIVTSAENILYAFRTPWGGNTLHASGRFNSWQRGHLRFFRFMRALHHYNVTPVNARWVAVQFHRGRRGIVNRSKRLLKRISSTSIPARMAR